MIKLLDDTRIQALRVIFKKPIFEDDFVERGMQAWFVGWETNTRVECMNLYFDFTEFEAENEKYFKRTFYGSGANRAGQLLTAKEAGAYDPKYSVYFGDSAWSHEQLESELQRCIIAYPDFVSGNSLNV